MDFLKSNTELQALSIQADAAQTVFLLRDAHFPSSLESITVFAAAKTSFPPLLPPSVPIWSPLDRTIEPLLSLRRLEIVHLAVSEPDAARLQELWDEIAAPMLAALPLCVARGIVTQTLEAGSSWRWL